MKPVADLHRKAVMDELSLQEKVGRIMYLQMLQRREQGHYSIFFIKYSVE